MREGGGSAETSLHQPLSPEWGVMQGRREEKETRLLVYRRRRKNNDRICRIRTSAPIPLRIIRRRRRRLSTDKP